MLLPFIIASKFGCVIVKIIVFIEIIGDFYNKLDGKLNVMMQVNLRVLMENLKKLQTPLILKSVLRICE